MFLAPRLWALTWCFLMWLPSITIAQQSETSYFFGNGTFYPTATVSTACSSAILGQVNCLNDLLTFAYADTFYPLGNATYQKQFCSPSCGSSLATYVSNVTKACSGQPEPFDGLPATYYGNWAWSTWNMTCLQDSTTGDYCIDYFFSLFSSTANGTETGFPQIAPAKLCTNCVYKLFQQMQGTPYSTYDADSAADWAQIQSICKVSHPTAIPTPISTNATIIPGYAPNVTYSNICLSGKTYTAVAGDNVQLVAQKNNVATGTLLAINQLLPGGSDFQVGNALCLPFTCQTHTVVTNDTCSQISTAANISLQSFLGYNPTINSYCSNLIPGQNVCVSAPGGLYNGTTIAGSIPTQTAIYATTTVAAPGPTAHGTTTNCGQYYQVQTGDYCQVVAVNQTISLPLFEAINPDIDLACDNLVPGLWYCVSPLQNWNQTGTSVTLSDVAAPTTTPDGSTDDCYQWYVVKANDTCALVERSFGITFSQLQMWNPNLNSNCGNLALGEAYCVNSPDTNLQPAGNDTVSAVQTSSSRQTGSSKPVATSKPPSTSVPTAVKGTLTSSTTVPAPTTTVSGTTSNCCKWHVVVSGDTCDKIDTANGITLAQFQLWNKSVNSGCGNIQVGAAYCVSSPITASSKAKRADGDEDAGESEGVGVGGWPIVKPIVKVGLPPKFPGLSDAYDKIAHGDL